jgi:hypothetical protein
MIKACRYKGVRTLQPIYTHQECYCSSLNQSTPSRSQYHLKPLIMPVVERVERGGGGGRGMEGGGKERETGTEREGERELLHAFIHC